MRRAISVRRLYGIFNPLKSDVLKKRSASALFFYFRVRDAHISSDMLSIVGKEGGGYG